jgi:hypothetical protein
VSLHWQGMESCAAAFKMWRRNPFNAGGRTTPTAQQLPRRDGQAKDRRSLSRLTEHGCSGSASGAKRKTQSDSEKWCRLARRVRQCTMIGSSHARLEQATKFFPRTTLNAELRTMVDGATATFGCKITRSLSLLRRLMSRPLHLFLVITTIVGHFAADWNPVQDVITTGLSRPLRPAAQTTLQQK